MGSGTRELFLVCLLFFFVVVGSMGYVLFQRSMAIAIVPEVDDRRPVPRRPTSSARSSREISTQLRRDIERQRVRIGELQQLLEKRESVLQQQAATLESKSAESQRLQVEADHYLQLLTTLVNESAQSLDDNLQDLNAMEQSETRTDDLDATPTVASLEAALAAAEWEHVRLSDTTLEAESLLAQTSAQFDVVRQAIVESGAAAVPVLIQMLSQAEPEVRTWAAKTLGDVAAESSVAIDALLVASDDDDVNVRTAARNAIQQLGPD